MKCREIFRFKNFNICQDGAAMKITTDTILCGLLAPVEHGRRILDIGTGTGTVALLIAQRAPQANIIALEPHLTSFRTAKFNFLNSPYASRIKIFPTPLQQFQPQNTYDLIITNPPFFDDQKIKNSPARHTSYLPLDELFTFVYHYLAPTGKFSIIYPYDKKHQVLSHAYELGLFPERQFLIRDRNDTPVKRIFWTFTSNINRTYKTEEIILSDKNGMYSKFYKQFLW